MKAIVAKISESGKSACVMVQTSPFSMNRTPVYIPNLDYKKGQILELPANTQIVDWVGRATKDGVALKTVA